MKFLKSYNEQTDNPDLRPITRYVMCKKTFFNYYKKGKLYKVTRLQGDPQRAVEIYGINDYMPVDCVNKIYIKSDNGLTYCFKLTPDSFFKYFDFYDKMKKILNVEEDPWNEEDWGYEKITEQSDSGYLMKQISFKNATEMVSIALKLKELGYDIYNYEKIMLGNTDIYHSFILWHVKSDEHPGVYVRSPSSHGIDYSTFLKILKKNRKFIWDSENDPWGEEAVYEEFDNITTTRGTKKIGLVKNSFF